ncbi:MAG: hypothetical protein WD381_02290, partial [Balneolaceae bacterium]
LSKVKYMKFYFTFLNLIPSYFTFNTKSILVVLCFTFKIFANASEKLFDLRLILDGDEDDLPDDRHEMLFDLMWRKELLMHLKQ